MPVILLLSLTAVPGLLARILQVEAAAHRVPIIGKYLFSTGEESVSWLAQNVQWLGRSFIRSEQATGNLPGVKVSCDVTISSGERRLSSANP